MLFVRVVLDESVEMFIQKVAKVTMWILLLLTVSGTLGVDVSAILAGLGIAGVALAFAAQDTLSNVVGGVFIMIDRPFKVGDRIVANASPFWSGVMSEAFRSLAKPRTIST